MYSRGYVCYPWQMCAVLSESTLFWTVFDKVVTFVDQTVFTHFIKPIPHWWRVNFFKCRPWIRCRFTDRTRSKLFPWCIKNGFKTKYEWFIDWSEYRQIKVYIGSICHKGHLCHGATYYVWSEEVLKPLLTHISPSLRCFRGH